MSTPAEPKEATEDLYESHDGGRPLKMARTDHLSRWSADWDYECIPTILGGMYPQFSSEEKEKIAVYVTMLLEGMPSEADVRTKTVYELKDMLGYRHHPSCKTTGRKEVLLDRILAFLKCRGEVVHKIDIVCDGLVTNMAMYGDDGMGDKPPGICRVEYWLAHLPFEGLQQA